MAGYRAFPKFPNPRSLPRVTVEEFDKLPKTEMQRAPSIAAGHLGTTVWYVKESNARYFVVQVDVEGHPPALLKALCTFTPSMGVDAVDGMLIEDAEHFVLSETLGFKTTRLDVYGSSPEINPIQYLASHGLHVQSDPAPKASPKVAPMVAQKKWWQFWR